MGRSRWNRPNVGIIDPMIARNLRWATTAFFLTVSSAVAATCPTTQATPQLTAGGSVFGRIASQWNAYFGSKVDANNGVLCNPTIIGGNLPTVPTAPLIGGDGTAFTGVEVGTGLALSGGTLRNTATSAGQGISLGSYSQGSALTTTGTILAGQTALVLADAIDFQSTCSVSDTNCGILIDGAGALPTVTAPTSPSATGSCASVIVTGDITSGSKVVRNTSALGNIAAGDAITGSGIPVGTTLSYYNSDLRLFQMSDAATTTAQSVTISFTDPCNSTYFFKLASFDENGGISEPTAAFSTSVGPARPSSYNIACALWTQPGGTVPKGTIVWISTDGGVTYRFNQTANVLSSTGSCSPTVTTALSWGGQPARPRPWWIPDSPSSIPAGGKAGWLATTISTGGGTTAITLASAAQTTVSSATVYHDDTAALAAWQDAINASTAPTQAFVPPGSYRTRSGITLTKNVPILADGATIFPLGPSVGSVIQYYGSSLGASLTPANNFQEGVSCLPLTSLSGVSVGDELLIQQLGPGGPSQAMQYTLISRVAQLSCASFPTAVMLEDSAPVTFTDAAHTETVTLTGQPGIGDTVTISVTGDASCAIVYTVTAGETVTTIATNTALLWNTSCSIAFATSTLDVITLQSRAELETLNWSVSVVTTGTMAAVAAAGTGYTVVKFTGLLSGVGVQGLTIDGQNAMGTAAGSVLVGVFPNGTTRSRYASLDLKNFAGGGSLAFYGIYNYSNLYDGINILRGAGGVINMTSYSDFWSTYETKSKFSNINAQQSFSFGSQFAAASYVDVRGFRVSSSLGGRGFKLGAVVASLFSNIDVSNGAFDNWAICCGTYQNLFSNIRSSYSYGINDTGITLFNAWDRHNYFVNVKSVGSRYNIITDKTNLNNVWTNVSTGTGGEFSTIYAANSNVFYSSNGCDKAVNVAPISGSTPTCQIQTGTWTPVLQGDTTPGSASYNWQIGTWEQNGPYITAKAAFNTTAALSGGSGSLIITGLPFAAATNVGEIGSCSVTNWGGLTLAGGTTPTAGVGSGSSSISLYRSGSGSANAIIGVAENTSAMSFYATCIYRIY